MWYYFIVSLFTIIAVAIIWTVIMYIKRVIQSQSRKRVLKNTVIEVVSYDLQHFDNRKTFHDFLPDDFRLSRLQRNELRYLEREYEKLFQQQFEKLEKLAMQSTLLQTLKYHQQHKELPSKSAIYTPRESE